MTKSDFFSGISASWDERHSTPEEQERLRRFAVHFRLRQGDRVLDAGCGSGRLVPLICEAVGPQGSLVELDFAPGMINIARGRTENGRVEFIVGDAHSLPLPDGGFDKVIALALLPHLDDRGAALKEFRRVLKPGGMLVIAHQLGARGPGPPAQREQRAGAPRPAAGKARAGRAAGDGRVQFLRDH